ncbi:ABC transporter substrate-binding protein [Thiohalorhabdus denitrificans]|uniref:Zinc/manganese transport system substrate-binding protein n=1 Tax=Thiohalorhabdus denitrificans TaxID=381306 RepID=A0A0P9CSK5_9GAMM|nr:zinc ABC transporter substrate-binding protein [Thiohalorhabdus denitrificans]KPV39673.1 ABC transporter substrate-binding protein [Thiohalorhabdus denitrificans]SCX94554.1 zinc/manganese transport system substrate-binding protein [Thiohalorhabdus denitrificans]
MIRVFLTIILTLAAALPVMAETRVAATTTSMAMLARTVGGDAVSVTTLAPPDRDTHYLQAKPSMIRDLRSADLVVAVGAELEVGWLPAAIRNAANPSIRPGRPGYFEAAAQVELLDAGGRADRSGGDVHPAGDPHVNLDPVRMAAVAEALADRLAELEPGHAAAFGERAAAFAQEVEQRLPAWEERVADSPGVVGFHKDIRYLLERLEVPIRGYLESKPGVPPSGSHLRELIAALKGSGPGVVIRHPFHPSGPVEKVAGATGWATAALPLDPPLGATDEDYFALIEDYVEAVAAPRRKGE